MPPTNDCAMLKEERCEGQSSVYNIVMNEAVVDLP